MKQPCHILILLLLMLSPAAAQKVLLRPSLEAGKVYVQEQVTDSETPAVLGQPAQTIHVVQTTEIRVSAEPGTKRKLAAVRMGRVQASIVSEGKTKGYDSEDPAKSEPFLQQTYGTMAGRTFTLVFDAEDRIVEVRGAEGMGGTPLAGGTGPDGAQLAEAYRVSYEMFLPKAPTSVGDVWSTEETVELPPIKVTLKASMKHEPDVVAEGRKMARISFTGTTKSVSMSGTVVVDDSSTLEGEALFDMDRKLVARTETRTKQKMHLNGQDLSTTMRVTSRLVSVQDAR